MAEIPAAAPSKLVQVRCISDRHPWADVHAADGSSVLRPMVDEEECRIPREQAIQLQKTKHVVMLER
jgi:hypothetical protein